MTFRHAGALLLSACLAVTLGACGEDTLQTSSAAPSAPAASEPAPVSSSGGGAEEETGFPVEVALDATVSPSLFAGLYAAQEQGYFSAEGLSVEAVLYTESGAPAVEKAAAGEADFAVASQAEGMAQALEEGASVTAVAALQQHSDLGLLSAQSRNLTRPKALAETPCTLPAGALSQALFQTALEADGGTFSEKLLSPVDAAAPDWAYEALQNGAEAVSCSYGWDGLLCKEQGLDFQFQFYTDISPQLDGYPAVLAANNTFLTDHTAETEAFLRALRAGYTYAAQNPQAAAAWVCERVPAVRDLQTAVERSLTWLAGKYRDEATHWGALDETRWNTFYTWMNSCALTETSLPLNTGFSEAYLPDAGETAEEAVSSAVSSAAPSSGSAAA